MERKKMHGRTTLQKKSVTSWPLLWGRGQLRERRN